MKEFKLTFNTKVAKNISTKIEDQPIFLILWKNQDDAVKKCVSYIDDFNSDYFKTKSGYVYRYDESTKKFVEVRKATPKDYKEAYH